MTKFQEGSGKSASFFFFTSNRNFVIKTLKDEELTLLTRKGLLEKYYKYLRRHPSSLLARFYCIITVKIKYMQAINVIVMDNLMGEHLEEALRVYDLKGSTFHRSNSHPSSDLSVRKDLNFLDDKQFRMLVSVSQQRDLLRRMEKDKEFLKQCELMDYSLLIVFFKRKNREVSSVNLASPKKRMSASLKSEGEDKFIHLDRKNSVQRDRTSQHE